MTQIYIENQELDINADVSNEITYSIDDLKKLEAKKTSFTKTIVLPGTNRNNAIFGNIFEMTSSNFAVSNINQANPNIFYNFNASISAKARIDIDGLTIMKGSLRLMEIVIVNGHIEYEVVIFGELGGLYMNMGAKKIEELDFSAYNHTYDMNSVINSWDRYAVGYGYFYPLIDYGQVSDITDATFKKVSWYYQAFRPALFVKEIMLKIIDDAGYKVTSNFFNTTYFQRLIVPNNQAVFAAKQKEVFSGSPTGAVQIGQSVLINNTIAGFFTTPDSGYTWVYTSPPSTFTGKIRLSVSGVWNMPTSPIQGNRAARLVIYKNGILEMDNDGGTIPIKSPYIGGQGNYQNVPFSFTFEFNKSGTPFTLAGGDNFSLRLEDIAGSGTDDIEVTIQSAMIYLRGEPIYTPVKLNDFINVSDVIPKNILQKDFFTSIMKMFNLMVIEDQYDEKHLIIEPYIDFYEMNNVLDWTDKVDRDKPVKIKPMSEITSRYYTLKYKADSDYWNDKYKKVYNEVYGEMMYDNQQEFANNNDSLEVIFAPSVLVGYDSSITDKVFTAIYKLNNNIEEQTDSIIRILVANKLDCAWYNIFEKDANGNPVLLTSNNVYGYAGHLDNPFNVSYDINFGALNELYYPATFVNFNNGLSNNLFNTFYSSYFAEITDKDSRLVTYYMKFNPSDIFHLDFRRFIFVDGVIYRLYKITDYKDGDVCQVDLLRVIYKQYTELSYELPSVNMCDFTITSSNLNKRYYNNGEPIPLATNLTEWDSLSAAGGVCCYLNFDESNSNLGLFYNRAVLDDARGFVPDGWRVPSKIDFITLFGEGCFSNPDDWRSIDTTHWDFGGGTNNSGFNALGLGFVLNFGNSYKQLGCFITSEVDIYGNAWRLFVGTSLGLGTDNPNTGYNIRLIKN